MTQQSKSRDFTLPFHEFVLSLNDTLSDKKRSKNTLKPFSVDASKAVVTCYKIASRYSEETGETPIPSDARIYKKRKKTVASFTFTGIDPAIMNNSIIDLELEEKGVHSEEQNGSVTIDIEHDNPNDVGTDIIDKEYY